MSEFIRPQVQVEEINETSARVSVEPLERGYGDTLGNSLRRVLLSSLEGAAVEAIQIDGAQHEFMTIPNMVEDVTDIVLNVKGLVFRALGTTDEATATISVDGPCEVTGADFFIPSEFELVNPEQHIATLTEGGHLINQHMAAFMNLAETPEVEEEASIFAPEVTNDNAELDKQIEDLDLSVRSYNCLKRASIHSVRQLVEFSENDLLNIRNFGVKSIEEVKDKLESMGLSLKA